MANFVIPRMTSIDIDAQNYVRDLASTHSFKVEPMASRMQKGTVDKPPVPIGLETSLRTGSMSHDTKDAKRGTKWAFEKVGSYMHAAPVVSEDPKVDLRSHTAASSSKYAPGGPLMYESAINRPVMTDWRMDPGAASRSKLPTTSLVNQSSGQRQTVITGRQSAEHASAITRFRQPLRADSTPMLMNESSTRDPLPIYNDSKVRAPFFSRNRGDYTTSRGKAIGLMHPSTYEQPNNVPEATAQITRHRGPTRTSQMLLNESIRPDIAQRLPLDLQPRSQPTRLNDLVKEVAQTLDEASVHVVGKAKKDVDMESKIYATALTHEGKKRATEHQARSIIIPSNVDAHLAPVHALPVAAGGISTRFAPVGATTNK